MDDESDAARRLSFARTFAIVLMIALGLRIFQATVGETPTAAASTVVVSPRPIAVTTGGDTVDQPGRVAQSATFVRLEWLDHCVPAQERLGLFTAADGPCRPSRTASLNWLQSQLASAGVLASGEYLERASNPAEAACLAVVLAGATTTPVGWLCSDSSGLYRVDATGRALAARWQMWIQEG